MTIVSVSSPETVFGISTELCILSELLIFIFSFKKVIIVQLKNKNIFICVNIT